MDTKIFNRRTSNSYHSHKRRAGVAGQVLDYTLADLRKKVEGQRYCPYCTGQLTLDTFSCDHARPTSRAGSFALWNVEVVCTTCNLAKGNLDRNEFGDLWRMLATWPAEIRIAFLARLRRGGKFR